MSTMSLTDLQVQVSSVARTTRLIRWLGPLIVAIASAFAVHSSAATSVLCMVYRWFYGDRVLYPGDWGLTKMCFYVESFLYTFVDGLLIALPTLCAVNWLIVRKPPASTVCRHCSAPLRGLAGPVCPECGRVYPLP